MRIAFIRKRFTPFGGAELYLQNLVTSLVAHGHDIHLYAAGWISPTSNYSVHKVPIMKGSTFIEALSFAYSVERLLSRQSYDIIFSFERSFTQDIYRAGDGCHREWLRRRQAIEPMRKRLFHRINPLHLALLFLEKRSFNNSKLIIANSHQVKNEILRHYHLDKEKIRVIYNTVDLQRFNPGNKAKYRRITREKLHIKDEEMLLLFVGSGFERKGLEFLVRAMAAVSKNCDISLKLVVAGKGKIEKYIKIAGKGGIADRIIYTGPVGEVEELYASSDLFILPTVYDPFSNACLEALATGVPVITTCANGASELLTDEENGYLVKDATDVSALESALVKFTQNPHKQEMQDKARHSAESIVKRYDTVAIYDEIFHTLGN